MKKLFYSLFALAMTAMTFTGCEDVPAPYDDPNKPSDKIEGAIPYTSLNLYTGWTLHKISADEPWSQGNSYTQATGYQKWEGADKKSNRAVEGYLISPKFNTQGSEHVKISFDQTIKYTNNVTGWADFHKIFVSTNYDGNNFDNATWQEVNFKPVASPYSDWTLYTSGEIQLPDEVADKENVYVAFWFKAPENASTTWELQNFKIEAGIAEESPEEPAATEVTCAEAVELTNALDDNATSAESYIITGYITQVVGSVSNGQQTFWMADTKDGGKVFEAYYANLPEGVSEFKKGSKVKITGNLTKYVKSGSVTAEMKNPTVEILEVGEDTPDTPSGDAKGDGTLENPYNPVAAANALKNLTWKINTEYQKTGDVYVKCKMSLIADKGTFGESGTYGNASFYISEDGSQKDEFYCFRILYLGNVKYTSGTDIKVGDEVIIYGKLMNYRGNTPETVAGEAYLYQLNNEGNGGNGGGGESANAGTYEAPLTVTEAIALANADVAWVKGFVVGYVKNGETKIENASFGSGANEEKDITNVLIAASASETSPKNCVPIQLPKGEFRDALNLKTNTSILGKELIISGQLTAYFSVPGIKSPKYAEIDGKTIGSK